MALFTGNYNHIRDGVSMTLNRLVEFLMEQGVKVLVFGPTVENPDMQHNGTLIPIPSKRLPGRPEYRFTTAFPERAVVKLEEFRPNLIHIATPDILGYKALKWAIDNQIPVVSSYHTHFASYLKYYKLSFLEPILWKYLKWFYGHCHHLYVPTPSMAETLAEKNIDCDLKIWARGIDTQKFNPSKRETDWRKEHGFSDQDLVITFVSRLVWEKNLRIFADVVSELMEHHSNVKALIVGDGPAGEELKEIFPEAVYTGFLTGNELPIAYACSDIFFFPSDTETFGNVTLEAMASGLPCVVADAVGSKSLVRQNQNGFRVSVDKTKQFYSKIEKLLTDQNLRERMSSESVKLAMGYSWDKINRKLLDYYREALRLK